MNRRRIVLLSLLSAAAYYAIGYEIDRSNSVALVGTFCLLFILYFFFISKTKKKDFSFLIGWSIVFRLLFLASIPLLSDDFFRFIWDGHLVNEGSSPFAKIPLEVQQHLPNKKLLLEGMNSPNYYSVYPPIAQYVFAISTALFPKSLMANIIGMRSVLILAEIGTLALLPRLLSLLHLPKSKTLLYALNPLVIVEISGNLHFEGLMIFFLMLAILMLKLDRLGLAVIAWTMSAATKLIPLLFLPSLLSMMPLRRTLVFYVLFGIGFSFLWFPFVNLNLLYNYYESIQLYHATFEFNASIYYLIRWVGFQFVGYNIIATAGSLLSKIALIGMALILLIPLLRKQFNPYTALLLSITFYYALALIVHPWYLCLLVFLSIFTRFHFAYVWSFLILFSYIAYNNVNYEENFLLIGIEYLLTFGILAFELYRNKGIFELNGKE
ncbi:MAG: glycosyltransferase ArnT-like protein [Verrucomicrobia bacterium]|nr:glycosyltransferase ArnT-like protein [Verrucomicrobiota bacterium]|tara:strand:+ start:37 stop:1350 length:1314 start_codon:yes stop_codon:yes gene_type:complete